jgi:hypothetical protein
VCVLLIDVHFLQCSEYQCLHHSCVVIFNDFVYMALFWCVIIMSICMSHYYVAWVSWITIISDCMHTNIPKIYTMDIITYILKINSSINDSIQNEKIHIQKPVMKLNYFWLNRNITKTYGLAIHGPTSAIWSIYSKHGTQTDIPNINTLRTGHANLRF